MMILALLRIYLEAVGTPNYSRVCQKNLKSWQENQNDDAMRGRRCQLPTSQPLPPPPPLLLQSPSALIEESSTTDPEDVCAQFATSSVPLW
jgi:hypothetical protein